MSLLDPKVKAEWDQGMAMLQNEFPQMARAYYKGLLNEGFTEGQAFQLVRDYMYSFLVKRDLRGQ